MHENDLYWLAGMFEGEGTFGISQPRNHNKNRSARLAIGGTDRDVMEKVASLIGGNVRTSPDPRPNRKTMYNIEIYGVKAEKWMKTLLPLMGERRSARIQEILDIRSDYCQEWAGNVPSGRGSTRHSRRGGLARAVKAR